MAVTPKADRRSELLEGSIRKSLLKLAIPIAVANVLQAAYQLIDAFWVGRLGGAAVAAVSIATPVMFLTIALGVGMAVAGSTLIAQYYGAHDQETVNHVAAQTLLMVVLVSVILGGIGFATAPLLLKMMGVDQEVFHGALGFMRVSFIGLVFNFFFFMFQSVMRGVGETKLPVYIVLGTVILNFLLDPLLIFGQGPIPRMGVMGAAVATLATQSLAAVTGLMVLLGGRYGIHLAWRDFKPDVAFIKRSFMLGLPVSVEQSARALGITVLTFLIASFGTLTVASYGVGSTILQIVMIPAMGLSMAISALVGQNIGAGNIRRAEQIGQFGATMAFAVLTVLGVIAFVSAARLAAFFVPRDRGVIDGAAEFLRIMALSWGFMGVQFALTGVLRASGNMVMTMVITLVSQWVLQFPLAYLLATHTGLGNRGIWIAFPITNIITALITIAVYKKGGWKEKRLVQSPAAQKEAATVEAVTAEVLVDQGIRER